MPNLTALRLDQQSNKLVPLTTKAGDPVGKRVFQPDALRPGQELSRSIEKRYDGYFRAQARNYQQLIASETNNPYVSDFAPECVVQMAIRAFAFHHGGRLEHTFDQRFNEANHMALIEASPDYQRVIKLFPDAKKQLFINMDATTGIINDAVNAGAGYLEQRPELAFDLGHLSAYFFAGNRKDVLHECCSRQLIDTFEFGKISGADNLAGIAEKNGICADLGFGLNSVYYINHLRSPKMLLVDVNPFNIALTSGFAALLGKEGIFDIRQTDLSKPCRDEHLSGFVDFALIHAVSHHILEDSGEEGLANLCSFIAFILKPGGNFALHDEMTSGLTPQMLVRGLQKSGLELTNPNPVVQVHMVNEETFETIEMRGNKPSI